MVVCSSIDYVPACQMYCTVAAHMLVTELFSHAILVYFPL